MTGLTEKQPTDASIQAVPQNCGVCLRKKIEIPAEYHCPDCEKEREGTGLQCASCEKTQHHTKAARRLSKHLHKSTKLDSRWSLTITMPVMMQCQHPVLPCKVCFGALDSTATDTPGKCKDVSVRVNETTTIGQLKEQIYASMRIPVKRQGLFAQSGAELQEDATVQDSSISDGDRLQLRRRCDNSEIEGDSQEFEPCDDAAVFCPDCTQDAQYMCTSCYDEAHGQVENLDHPRSCSSTNRNGDAVVSQHSAGEKEGGSDGAGQPGTDADSGDGEARSGGHGSKPSQPGRATTASPGEVRGTSRTANDVTSHDGSIHAGKMLRTQVSTSANRTLSRGDGGVSTHALASLRPNSHAPLAAMSALSGTGTKPELNKKHWEIQAIVPVDDFTGESSEIINDKAQPASRAMQTVPLKHEDVAQVRCVHHAACSNSTLLRPCTSFLGSRGGGRVPQLCVSGYHDCVQQSNTPCLRPFTKRGCLSSCVYHLPHHMI